MLFNSAEFLVFLPLTLALYHLLPLGLRKPMLLLASYWFYAAWDPRFLALLWLSTAIDYGCGLGMRSADPARRRWLLRLSLISNLGILATFKYFDFFVASFRSALAQGGLEALDSVSLELILPLGISFYTFQTLGYTIDVYRGTIRPCERLLDYAVFVAYFPQLVAGPIERASRLLPQLATYHRPGLVQVRTGLTLILFGFFKKVVVGDALISGYVELAFGDPGAHHPSFLLLGAFLFSIQIYVDFSGYSDIARGVSRLLGIELMVNFDQPYLSRNIGEFWRRWHISLSTWLRDYLYIPLGGNRGGRHRTYRNLLITMVLGGLWHGASWNFVVWGAIHGLVLAGHRFVVRDARSARGGRAANSASGAIAGCLATNLIVVFAWIFFRSPDLASAIDYLAQMSTLVGDARSIGLAAVVLLLYFGIVLALDWAPYRTDTHEFTERWPEWARVPTYAILLLMIWTAWPASSVPFIYFQF